MFKHALGITILLTSVACAANPTTEKTTAKPTETTTTTTATTGTTPTDVCNQLVAAAKTDKIEEVTAVTLMPTGKMDKTMKGKFHKMHGDYLAKIKDITCGTAHTSNTHAFVEADNKGEKRFIPFVNVNGQWKFDMKTYKSFYVPATGHHGKGHAGKKTAG